MVNEVRVTQLVPGSHLAQLISLGAVYLPRGGSEDVDLSGQFSSPPALIGDLGADAGAQLAVGAPVGDRQLRRQGGAVAPGSTSTSRFMAQVTLSGAGAPAGRPG